MPIPAGGGSAGNVVSYTTVKAIYPGEKCEDLFELRNSWGSAPVVWEAMAARYLGVTKSYGYPDLGWMQLQGKLWDLWKRTDIPVEHRMVFMLTFDRAFVAQKDYARMVAAIRRFLADFPPKPGAVNHWSQIALILENKTTADMTKIPGVGLHCTSVSRDTFLGPWNEAKEEHDQPDWTEIYDLCEQIDSLEVKT